ncbi:hypothetical protein [Spirosoma sp.]|uniref:hypothetical protein n=1 Tax=Spirosoma sp. TaxID=1899569 RepID=UPI003B3B1F3A
MKSKLIFVAGFAGLFFVGYALVWYALNLISALKFYGNLPQALGDSPFHITALTDTYEMTTRLIVGVGLGLLVWSIKKKAQPRVVA